MGTAIKHPDDPNNETEAVEFDALVGAVRDALMQTEDGNTLRATAADINAAAYLMPVAVDESDAAVMFAVNNADMADFTLLDWIDSEFGEAEADGMDWSVVLKFETFACESKVEGYAAV